MDFIRGNTKMNTLQDINELNYKYIISAGKRPKVDFSGIKKTPRVFELIREDAAGNKTVLFESTQISELFQLINGLGAQITIYPDDDLFSEMIHMDSTEDILELVA
jgi:hypothetical protein